MDLTCNPNLPLGDREFLPGLQHLVRAPADSRGTRNQECAGKYPFVGPGVNNFDLSLFKNFQLGRNEERRLQFRLETYNAFNHAQFTTVDNNARFDSQGNQVNRAFWVVYRFAAPSRRIELGVKLYL